MKNSLLIITLLFLSLTVGCVSTPKKTNVEVIAPISPNKEEPTRKVIVEQKGNVTRIYTKITKENR